MDNNELYRDFSVSEKATPNTGVAPIQNGIEIPEIAPMGNTVMEALSIQIKNFPNMFEFVQTEMTTPSYLLTPKGLDFLFKRLTHDIELLSEAYGFLDTISLYETFHFGTGKDSIINSFLFSLVKSRTGALEQFGFRDIGASSKSNNFVLNQTEFSATSAEELLTLLDNNRPILSIYIYSLVAVTYGLDISE